ncbi:MAG TPA: hypothetical protein PLF11_13515 [Bacillota bacterium]|jgi:hypothetical protein|nr:hypothetical protein [Bacillota bacterium]
MNCARGNDLAGEIIACLRVNLLRGTLTTQDDAEFERLLDEWSDKALSDAFGMTLEGKTLGTCTKCGGHGWVRGVELDQPSDDTAQDTMTRYTCDLCGGTGRVTDDQITPAKTLAEEIQGEIERLEQLAVAATTPGRHAVYNNIAKARLELAWALRSEQARIEEDGGKPRNPKP